MGYDKEPGLSLGFRKTFLEGNDIFRLHLSEVFLDCERSMNVKETW